MTIQQMLFATGAGGYSFTSHTFTAGTTSGGASGPSTSTLQTAYASSPSNPFLSGTFSVSNGVQLWYPPVTGTYKITLKGAHGGGNPGSYYPADPGEGATMIVQLTLNTSTQYKLVVGQKPDDAASRSGSAGGGASWIYTGSVGGSGLIACAGGGGGWGHGTSNSNGGNGMGGSNGNSPNRASQGGYVNGKQTNGTGYSGGTGQGGGIAYTGQYGGAGGGAGWYSDGSDRSSAYGNADGGHSVGSPNWQGGYSSDSGGSGGFGGGGGSNGSGEAGGGGGGYSGGPAGNDWSGSYWGSGGGGGSYYSHGYVSASSGDNGGAGNATRASASNGYITIEFIS